MTEIRVLHFDRVRAPLPWKRDRAVSPTGLRPESSERYDFDTLFYDIIRRGPDIVIVAPKLLNFKKLVRSSRFRVGGQDVGQPIILPYYRHCLLHFRNAPDGETLRIEFPGGEIVERSIAVQELDFLSGLNCELTISKNNDLAWITEKLTYHKRRQGLEAMVIVDNGSTDYGIDDLCGALKDAGLKRAVIISAPYPFGGRNNNPVHADLFLQTATFNVARLRYLQMARAVLNVDIDEVVCRTEGHGNIFDMTCDTRLGLLIFPGRDMYPGPEMEPPFSYQDHRYCRPSQKETHKWCLNPRGPMGGLQWRPHNLESNVLRRWQTTRSAGFYHCLGVTTSWKRAGRWTAGDDLVADRDAVEFWDADYGPAIAKDR